MQRSRWPSVARQLLNEVPDADLLERYVQQHADDAFAQLVTRYSRLVWGQCRNLLPNDADADDAFQATFLTLARSAKSIRAGAPLGPWLHGVAYRVCLNARRASVRRAKREKACARLEADRPVADSTWESAFAAVAEEVQKLPEAQRAAFVLCCIEGRATTEVAASLGQKLGTFSARLTRAKQTLLDRLAKRGIGAAVLALGGVTGSVSVAPAALIARTLALIPSGVTIPSSVLVLTHGVTGMLMLRFKLLAAGVMVATGLGLSVGGGWSGEAMAQVASSPATKPAPPKGDGAIEKLKAELEKAKAELAKTEAEMRMGAVDRVLLAGELKSAATATKYEYEPVPKEGLTDFVERLTTREKAGWTFVGQVTIKGFGPEEKLVFRKSVAPPTITWQGPMRLNTRDGDFEIPAPGSPAPPAISKRRIGTIRIVGNMATPQKVIADQLDFASGQVLDLSKLRQAEKKLVELGLFDSKDPPRIEVLKLTEFGGYYDILVVVKEIRNSEKGTPMSADPVPPKYMPSGDKSPDVRKLASPHGWSTRETEEPERLLQEAAYKNRIAELEKQVAALGGKPKSDGLPEHNTIALFAPADYGTWNPKDLADVLLKLMVDDPEAKPTHGSIQILVSKDGMISVTGSASGVDAVRTLVKKLKK